MKNLVICVVMMFTMISGMIAGTVREQNNHEWDSEMEATIQDSFEEAKNLGYEDYSVEYEPIAGSRYFVSMSFVTDEGDLLDTAFVWDAEDSDRASVLYARVNDEWQYDWD